jgi:hypothetical protein
MMIEIEGSLVDKNQIWSLTAIKQSPYNEDEYIFNVMVNSGYVEVIRPTIEECEKVRQEIKNKIEGEQNLYG